MVKKSNTTPAPAQNLWSRFVRAIVRLWTFFWSNIWNLLIALVPAALASPLVLSIYQQWQLPAISERRRTSLEGKWEGKGKQSLQSLSAEEKKKLGKSGNSFVYPAHLNLNVGNKTLTGTLEIVKVSYANQAKPDPSTKEPSLDKHMEVSYELTGMLVAPNYIRLDYNSKDPGIIEFGTLMLRIPASGNALEGKFISFGPITESLADGEYVFNRANK